MSVYKRPGQSVFSYDFHFRGSRFSGSTGCTSRREAVRFEEVERSKAKSSVVDASKPMTFGSAASLYWDQTGRFLVNHDNCIRDLAWLLAQIGYSHPISKIDDREIARVVAVRRCEGVSNATVNRTVTEPLRAILRRARSIWKQKVEVIQWKEHFLDEPQERVREASVEEERKLMASIRSDYAPALRFAILTGCRRAEIVGLRWRDVDFVNREFTVRGKGKRSRTIPMTDAIYELLWSQKDYHKTAVFTYVVRRPRKGAVKGERQPITKSGLATEWRRSRGRTDVENYRFHDNRHTAATRLVRATGNLQLAQQLLGHSDIATTMRYSHVTKGDLLAGMEAVSAKSPPKAPRNKRNRG